MSTDSALITYLTEDRMAWVRKDVCDYNTALLMGPNVVQQCANSGANLLEVRPQSNVANNNTKSDVGASVRDVPRHRDFKKDRHIPALLALPRGRSEILLREACPGCSAFTASAC